MDATAANGAKVDYWLFGGPDGFAAKEIATASITAYGWVTAWNTTTVPNGSYVVVSEAIDGTTDVYSAAVPLTVDNAAAS